MIDKKGIVTIAGAGPGDPELLTLKVLKRLQDADVVLHDSLISKEILKLVPDDAETVNVGKRCGDGQDQEKRQERINAMMIGYALEGKYCVRLKAGDPFVFGRGVEEVRALMEKGIEAEVIPGITAGLAAANMLQIPVTERNRTSSLLFCTGHTASYSFEQFQGVLALLRDGSPVVMYMGMKNFETIVNRLLDARLPVSLQVSIVSKVSLCDQKVITGMLETIGDVIREQDIETPAVFFIGEHTLPVEELFSSSAGILNTSEQKEDNEEMYRQEL